MSRNDKPRTGWYNAKAHPPVRTGWYEFRRVGQVGMDRFHYNAVDDAWRNFPSDRKERASPSAILNHCEWRGLYLGGKRNMEADRDETGFDDLYC